MTSPMTSLMRHLLRSIFVTALAALLIAGANSPSGAARRRTAPTRAFDGLWSVMIMTRYGDCDRAYRYALRIVGGRAVNSAEGQDYRVDGAVGRSGAIRVIVARGGDWADGSGRLSGNRGSGRWRTSSGQCGGVWSAERRSEGQ